MASGTVEELDNSVFGFLNKLATKKEPKVETKGCRIKMINGDVHKSPLAYDSIDKRLKSSGNAFLIIRHTPRKAVFIPNIDSIEEIL